MFSLSVKKTQSPEVQDARDDGSTALMVALDGAPAKVKNDASVFLGPDYYSLGKP